MRPLALGLACLLLSLSSGAAARQIVVVVSEAVPVDSLDRTRLIDIYTLNSTMWDDKSKIHVVDFKGEPAIKRRFYGAMDISLRDMRRIWLRKLLSGKATPPTACNAQEEVAQQVASTPGLIGYVEADRVIDGLRVLHTIDWEE